MIGRKGAVGRLQRLTGQSVIKRSVALAVACALMLGLLILSGCQDTGDVQGASKLIENGNAQYKAFFADFADLADRMEKFFASYSHAVKPTTDQARASMQDFREKLQVLLAKVEKAREPYKKVMAMQDVQHYQAYVDLRLDMLDQFDKTADIIKRAFPFIEQAINQGKLPDANGLEGAKRELIGIEMEASFIEAQADELVSDTHLKVKVDPPTP
jgi:hypothetical protein